MATFMDGGSQQDGQIAATRWQSLLLVSVLLVVGCAQPPYAANAPGAYPGYGAAPNSNPSLANRSRFWPDMRGLYERAQTQEKLAAEQQTELARLRDVQQKYDELLAAMEQKSKDEAAAKLQQQYQYDAQLAEKARNAIGRYSELDERAKGLDSDNRDLLSRMAKTQQEYQRITRENELLKQQLRETVGQLTAQQQANQMQTREVQALQASMRKRGGAGIRANNSLRRSLTAVTVRGLDIRQDGELVKIVLPTDRLFSPGTAQLIPGAEGILDQVADVLLANYPKQIIGVESHADSSPVASTLWRSHHQMTAAQSMAIFEQLSVRHRLLPDQLFVLGHGQNYPIASNATPAGQTQNRRVEIVVYPETYGNR
ncbi:MAG: OmpA family protein [Pirellulaceae bacterium]